MPDPSKQWDVTMTAPNGTNGHFTADGSDPERCIAEFTKFVQDFHKSASQEVVAGIEGVPATQQPVKQATRQR